ncbi:MAG: rotamase [Caulobacter sp.]|nr:rotamase [Caulobacter sp.]
MLSSIRAFAKSWFAWVIFGALVVSFGLISPNVRDFIIPSIDTWVVNADGRKFEQADFKRVFDNYKKGQEQRMGGQQITLEQVVQYNLDKQLLDEVADQLSLNKLLANLGLKPSPKLVEAMIQKEPGFFNPVTGEFDPAKFAQVAAENGMTPVQFREMLTDQISGSHFGYGAAQGLRLPRVYTAMVASYAMEARDGAFFSIDARTLGPIAPPTDAEMQAFINQHAKDLMNPEFRVISVIHFSAKDAAAQVKVDEAEVLKRFNFAKDSLSVPEKRSLIQIPVKDQAAAAAVAGRLQKGEDALAVAKSLKIQPIIVADKPRSAIGDKRLSDAAFALADGQVSGPIQGDLGWAVVKITGVTAGHEATIEEVRPKIEEALKTSAAEKIAYDKTKAFDDARAGGANFADAAAKAGVRVDTIGPVSERGMGSNRKPAENLDEKVLASAFALPMGGESDSVEEGATPGEWYVVRVEKVIAPAMPTLAELKPDLSKLMQDQTLKAKLGAKGQELQARVRAGEPLEKVAASVGAKVTHIVGVDRVSTQEHAKQLGEPFLNAMNGSKAGEVFLVQAPPPALALIIGKVDAVRMGDVGDMARFTETRRPQFTMQYMQELGKEAATQAGASLKTKKDLGRARKAIGVTPDQIAALDPTAKADAKKKKK